MENTSGIYRIDCTENNKYYYGSTENFRKRWNKHKSRLRQNKHDNRHLQFAWNKYGKDAFTIIVAELVDIPHLLEIENKYLKEHVGNPLCFNVSAEATAPMQGLKLSEEARHKISKANKRRVWSAESRLKASEAAHNRAPQKRTEETCRKISEALKGKPKSVEHRRKLSEFRKTYRKVKVI
jgi:group I intron endonuclease